MKNTIQVIWNMAGLSQTTSVMLLGIVAFVLLSFSGTKSIHQRALQQNAQENGWDQQSPMPSEITNLLHLYETLPNRTSMKIPPPFREVTHVFSRRRAIPLNHITLATQLSVSKLTRLRQLLERWNGPISCAVHLPDASAIQELFDFVQAQDKLFHDLVTFHVMLEKPSPAFGYPINRLRNLALLNIDTEYFFNNDVDFMPQVDAHDKLSLFLSTKSDANDTYKKLYVLPAFEVFGEGPRNNSTVTSLDDMPKNKKELLSMLRTRKLKPFHMDYYKKGHAPTDYDKWYTCQEDGIVSYPIEYSWRFEPYVVGSKYGIPTFNERLRGFGLNKAAWVAEAHLQGYKFEVLCDHFVAHMNHDGREGRTEGLNGPAVRWFQQKYLPGRYVLEGDMGIALPKRRWKRPRRRMRKGRRGRRSTKTFKKKN